MRTRKRKIINTVASRILLELAEKYYDGRCFVTHELVKSTGFTLHHLWYIDGDVIWKHYPKTPKGRDEYYKKLKPLVEKKLTKEEIKEWIKRIEIARDQMNNLFDEAIENPTRFILITNGIHTRIDGPRGLSRMKADNFKRLVLAVLLTRK